ncbi:MAG: isoprenylcysteine carboxylmethyltransferase family protein [Acidobacteria bacterium]|nr:isoprenylcysteine carboxylmethyltransferase family protein [Acidobacteriota bacterium]
MHLLSKTLDNVAFIYALTFFPAPFFWLLIHPAIDFWRRQGTRAYWVALPVWAGTDCVLFLVRPVLYARRFDRSLVLWVMGVALIALALWLDRGVLRQFSVRRIVGLPEIHPERGKGEVVRGGIYAYIRHPRYLEYILTFFGLALLTGALGIFALAIVTYLMYLIVAPLEERELRDRYGAAYEAYAREVPRFIPRLRRKPRASVSI